ncbi:MarR family winged helix-turn-helix transcriptional regulator [Corticibacterium sp. UT-5YL-CI-8]|nr:MarR family winged helix-turn-helix transcriptional regulator [Tianweitania sp. UT-5YL-CI-8]
MSKPPQVPYDVTILVRDCCLCLHVQRAARSLARRFDEAFRPLGLTHGQFSLMMSLNRPEQPKISDVSQLLAMDRTTLTANLKPLERRGVVEVAVDKNDRRGRRLSLTAEGESLLKEATPIWIAAHAQIEKALGEGMPETLRGALMKLS